jgi:hypothetical protein
MKNRYGFVSNSSSSSFILAVNKDVEEITAIIKIPLSDICNNTITTVKELRNYIFERYGFKDQTVEDVLKEKYVKDVYDKGLKQLNQGKVLKVGCVTNECCDGNLELFIYDNGLEGLNSKDIEIVEEVAI